MVGQKNVRRFLKEEAAFFLKEFLLIYTFIALFLKSIIFVGFIYGSTPAESDWRLALHYIPSLGVYSCFILVLLSVAFLFKRRARFWYLAALNLSISVLFLFDLWYYRGFGNLMNLHLLRQTANLQNLSECIISMSRTADIVFVFDAVIILLFAVFSRNSHKEVRRSVFLFSVLFAVSSGFLVFKHYAADIAGDDETQRLFKKYWVPKTTITNLSPLGYHIYDSYNFWKDNMPFVLNGAKRGEIEAWFESKKENLPDNEFKAVGKGKNLIIIQVESLENFVIDRKINGQEITPNINRLLNNSIYFPNIHEQVHYGTSSDADFMTNVSVYPVRSGSTFFRFPYNYYNSLPRMLEGMGYSTLAVHPDDGAFWNWMEALKSIGFQKCLDVKSFNITEQIGLGISDGAFLKQVGDVLVGQRQPFYAFIVTLSSHGPFNIPDKFRELNLDEKIERTKLGGYFQSMHYTDKHIGLLLSKLEKEGLMDNTVVVVYGDHCGIHKYYQDELEDIEPREDWWYEKNTCVPFIIYDSRFEGKRFETVGGQIDILPTLAYVMGVEEKKYENTAMGRNLLKTSKSFAVLSDGSFVGTASSEADIKSAQKGLEIADTIIRSNYFLKRDFSTQK